ncbi:MAG TPA: phosphonate metabolism transcriptional regulator PhnF [Acetobacteraceae bacterium]|jgi:GntR family transcriptional regulator, phosphonate transport system regulatory protein|nr:phosphonate metabolism transcriptional regulator PhnF [Acetobacteraceae bacterium]
MTPADGATATKLVRDGVALWRRIAETLQREIVGGTLPAGTQLPTEAALAARFGVNRHTVRRALEELSRTGLIRVEQGRGSFVAEDVLDYLVGPRTRFSEWIRRHNREPSGRMLDLRELEADSRVAAGLGLRGGAKVVLFEHLGLADGRPISLASHYFPPTRLRGILAALREERAVTRALARVGVADYLRQSTRVTARMPTPAEAELLQTPRSRPLLHCENVNVDRAGTIVEFGIARYPTPRVQVVFEP